MNLEQLRAHGAFSTAREAAALGEKERKDFLGIARSLPAMLQINGLLASWTFLLRNEGANARLLTALLRHLRQALPQAGYALLHRPGAGLQNVLVGAGELDDGAPTMTGSQLRSLTAESIRFATWLKRAAEALCDTGAAPSGSPQSDPPAREAAL